MGGRLSGRPPFLTNIAEPLRPANSHDLRNRRDHEGPSMNETTEFTPFPGAHKLADLGRRVPRAVWPFIVLAAAQILFLTVPGGGGYLDMRIVAILVIPTLLPVAVLVGRPDAWNSARLIMIGAILWGSAGALVQVFGLGQFRFAPDNGSDTVSYTHLRA